ncbi:diphthine--ammonia ligase [Fluviispira multicolorata]|uniref:Diphthine--ammonia ligase n=1 Tax=Fluviispira multicolorata TaxID=2654512 RepID=A0A833N5J3_9BACT|nr:diphthine--ammonia ligase [Fluviispira multicolorata]KAB8033444.1 diphthine--ammonia ligase [Fluviispira multicolorata]
MEQKNLFCMWSGGHDSCLALYDAQKSNQIKCIITPIMETNTGHRTHSLSPHILRAQADLLNIPLLIFNTSLQEFEKNYELTLASLKKHKIDGGFFNEITNEERKNLAESICERQKLSNHFPLWQKNKEAALSDFLENGFKAKIIAVNEKCLTREFLGKNLDKEIIEEFRNRKIDIWGENGEYQTIIHEAPFFKDRLILKDGDINLRNGYWTLDISILNVS